MEASVWKFCRHHGKFIAANEELLYSREKHASLGKGFSLYRKKILILTFDSRLCDVLTYISLNLQSNSE